MLRGMTAADDHLPGAPADLQKAALAQTAVMVQGRWQEMGVSHHREHFHALGVVDPGLAIEIEEIPARWLVGGKPYVQRLELARGHVNRAVETLRKPCGHPGMVGVKMGADHRQNR